MALLPCGRVELVIVAMPLPLSVTRAPKATPLVLNCTVPVGVPVLGDTALNVAVKMTFDPGSAGFAEEVKALAELAVKTTLAEVPIAMLLMGPVMFAVP